MILLCSAFVNAQRGGIAVRRVLINFLVTGIARSRGIVARHKKRSVDQSLRILLWYDESVYR